MDKTIEGGVNGLKRHQVSLTREQWLKEAERCESDGSSRTCEAIVKTTVAMELEDEDRLIHGLEMQRLRKRKEWFRLLEPFCHMPSSCILIRGIYGEKRLIWRKPTGLGLFLSFVFLYLSILIFKKRKFRCYSRRSRY